MAQSEAGELIHIVEVTDAKVWDRTLLALPNPHILQSWAWGEFKSRHGWRATRLLFQEGGETVAAASVLQRKLPRLPASILYVPKGPALDWTDADLAEGVLEQLECLVQRRGALFVKVDPDVYYLDDAPSFSSRPACALGTARLLKSRAWRFSEEQIQFRNTLLLDLTRSEDELLAAMKQKTRYNVRLAARRGVIIHRVTAADSAGTVDSTGRSHRELVAGSEPDGAEALDLFYRLYVETARRDGFIIRPPDYYRDLWGTFLHEGLAHLHLAEFEGEIVAGLILFTYASTAWYMYGASSDRHRRHMPNYLLQWEAIRQAKAEGCTLYDLWGAPDSPDESDPMWGVVRFKQGLGGQLVRGLGAWDFAANRAGYWLYTVVMPRYLSWLQARNPVGG